jgi:hypothetical protein
MKRTSNGWSDRFMSEDTLEHPWLPGKDESRMFTFRSFGEFVTQQGDSSAFIQCYGASDQAEDYSPLPLMPNRVLGTQTNDEWDKIPLDTNFVWIHFKGKVAAKYTVGGNKFNRSVPYAEITFSIEFVGDEVPDAKYWFHKEYDHVVYWQNLSAPGPDDPNRLQMKVQTDINGEYSDSFYVMARGLYRPNVMDNIRFKVEVITLPPVKGWRLF